MIPNEMRTCDTFRSVLVETLDVSRLRALHTFADCLTPNDVRLRFGTPRRLASDEEVLAAFRCQTPENEMIWALAPNGAIAGIATLSLVEPSTLELGVIVRSDMKRRGIGACLLEAAKRRARRRGIRSLLASILWDNRPMRTLIAKAGFVATGPVGLLCEYELALSERIAPPQNGRHRQIV